MSQERETLRHFLADAMTHLGQLVLLVLLPGGTVAQAPVATAHLRLELADLRLAADPFAGLILILEPALDTRKRAAAPQLLWLRFHPDTALEWINSAAYAMNAAVPQGAPEGVQWSRTLSALNSKGAVTLGRDRRNGKLRKGRWLAVGDSASGVRVPISPEQADSVLQMVLRVGTLARIDTVAAPAFPADRVETPARLLHQPAPASKSGRARVLVQFVVDTSGRADPQTLVVFSASDSSRIPAALEVIRASRYQPARLGGQPVRQLMQRVILWEALRG